MTTIVIQKLISQNILSVIFFIFMPEALLTCRTHNLRGMNNRLGGLWQAWSTYAVSLLKG